MSFLHFFWHYYLSILASAWEISKRMGENMMVQKKDEKFSFCLCIVDLSIITGSLDKLNRTSKAQV